MTDIDPIEEIHRIRKQLYAEAGGNPDAYALFLRSIQEGKEGGRLFRSSDPKSNRLSAKKIRKISRRPNQSK